MAEEFDPVAEDVEFTLMYLDDPDSHQDVHAGDSAFVSEAERLVAAGLAERNEAGYELTEAGKAAVAELDEQTRVNYDLTKSFVAAIYPESTW